MKNDVQGKSLPDERAESAFEDYKPAWSKDRSIAEANRCLYCEDAPCITACPTGIDVPTFIRKIATDNVKGAARTILDSNVLGMSCARVCPVEVLCVGSCVYNHTDRPPIQIGQLQRYATDEALARGWQFHTAGADTGKSVGLVGAGPASLAAAHKLRQFGHAVTIYEKRDVVGGLNTFGVAPYKLKAKDALAEIEWLSDIGGIEIKTGVNVGEGVSFAELEAKHDALFVGLGLGEDRVLSIPGTELEGVYGAVQHIEAFKLGRLPTEAAKNIVVLGGGNTALDCVREALAILKMQNTEGRVTMAYRRDERRMSGYGHEWAYAKQEGASPLFHVQPTAIVGDEKGRVSAVRFVRLNDASEPTPGSEFEIEADAVLFAVGQSKLGELLSDLEGVEFEDGRILTDEQGATGRPGVWAGGDCRNGGKEVVNAVAEGRDAAIAMHAFLMEK